MLLTSYPRCNIRCLGRGISHSIRLSPVCGVQVQKTTYTYWSLRLTMTEAIGKGQSASDIVALSIGTASVALPWPEPGESSSPYVQPTIQQGLVTDLRKLAMSILDDPPDIASFLAHVMTDSGHGVSAPADSRIVRMNPLISPVRSTSGSWTAPGPMTAAQFIYLANLDMDAVEQPQVDTITCPMHRL